MLELRLTPRAEADLEDIWTYTADTWGAAQAERYVDDLLATFWTLCDMPGMARDRTEVFPPVRLHPTGRHVVIYREAGEALEVIRVLGGRQDWGAVLRALDR